KEGLRITAWHGPNNQRSRKPGRPGEQLLDYGAIDLSKGGSAIPYHQEDPAIRKEFEAALAREGVASRMNAEFYQRPPAAGEVVMGDAMKRGNGKRGAAGGKMKRSTDQIPPPHGGSLPRPADLLDAVRAKEAGKPIDEKTHAARLRAAVTEVVRKQV